VIVKLSVGASQLAPSAGGIEGDAAGADQIEPELGEGGRRIRCGALTELPSDETMLQLSTVDL
jgi:hypothetical protein